MSSTQAIVVDPQVAGRLAIREVERPTPTPLEALVRVHAISLNVGDIYRISLAEAGGNWDGIWQVLSSKPPLTDQGQRLAPE